MPSIFPCSIAYGTHPSRKRRLPEGGSESQCGWLKDRFGVSWQVVPRILEELMAEPARSKRVADAFMKMRKFDIETLLKA